MTLDEYQQHHNITNAVMCRLLNEARPSGTDSPVYEYRLARLKAGEARPTARELYLVQAVTGDECDGYR